MTKEARNVAMIRMIFSKARKDHQERESFQSRLSVQEAGVHDSMESGSSLSESTNSREILGEVLQDVAGAVKACSLMDVALEAMRVGRGQISEGLHIRGDKGS